MHKRYCHILPRHHRRRHRLLRLHCTGIVESDRLGRGNIPRHLNMYLLPHILFISMNYSLIKGVIFYSFVHQSTCFMNSDFYLFF